MNGNIRSHAWRAVGAGLITLMVGVGLSAALRQNPRPAPPEKQEQELFRPEDLVLLEGPKTMIVFSAGLVNDDPSLLDEVRHLAAAARTTINVIAVDRERNVEIRGDSSGQIPNTLVDRNYETQGLELIADNTGGTFRRAIASAAMRPAQMLLTKAASIVRRGKVREGAPYHRSLVQYCPKCRPKRPSASVVV